MSPEIETTPVESALDELDFAPRCEAKRVNILGRKTPQCSNEAEYFVDFFAHTDHAYHQRTFCQQCLDKVLAPRRKIPWCLRCRLQQTVRSYRRIW